MLLRPGAGMPLKPGVVKPRRPSVVESLRPGVVELLRPGVVRNTSRRGRWIAIACCIRSGRGPISDRDGGMPVTPSFT